MLTCFECSASIDGRVYVWKIAESPDEEDKPQITGKIVIAVQIVGEGESVHPQVCWHCHKQVTFYQAGIISYFCNGCVAVLFT